VREARRAKARPVAAPPDELAQVARASDRLLRRLEAVTATGLRRDPAVVSRLRDLHRRLAGILGDD
jgi:hypothetical protein